MNFNLVKVILTGLCVVVYLVGWYNGLTYPAWVPALWCGAVFMQDLIDYLES